MTGDLAAFAVRFVLAALACFRIGELVALDDGPLDLCLRLRVVAGCHDRGSNGRIKTGAGRLFACPYCIGVWIAVPLAYWLVGMSAEIIIVWIALAGAQAFLQSIGGRT